MKDLLSIIVGALLGIVAAILAVYVTTAVGYLFGILITVTPFLSEWMTVEGLVDPDYIPGIVSWVFFISILIGSNVKVGIKSEEQ